MSGFGGGSGIAHHQRPDPARLGNRHGLGRGPVGATILSGTGDATGSGIGTLTLANSLNLASGGTVADYLGTPGSGTASVGNAGLINVQGNLTLPASGLNLSLLNNSGAGGLGSAGNGFYELFYLWQLERNAVQRLPGNQWGQDFHVL